MHRSVKVIGLILVLFALLFTACSAGGARTPTTDPQAIYTSAAKTVGAELTRSGALTPSATFTQTVTQTETTAPTTAVTVSTTPTTSPTEPALVTPTTPKTPDKAEFVSQSVADGTRFSSGQAIKVSWVIKNIGTTTWAKSYSAKFYAGDLMDATTSFAFSKEIKPGDQIEIAIEFKAPEALGKKSSIWVLQNANGINFYPFYLNVEIVAAPPTNTPLPATSTATPAPTTTITLTSAATLTATTTPTIMPTP